MYLLLEDIYDKTIELDLDNEEDISKINKNNMEKEFNNIYDTLKVF